MYTWNGMKKLNLQQVKEVFDSTGLIGYFKLYPDNTEAEIDSKCIWSDICEHIAKGGEIGEERSIA